MARSIPDITARSSYAGLFVSHGAPTLPLEDEPARAFLRELGAQLPRPRAIVALSPHWLTSELSVKAPERFETWHDFQGFPRELNDLRYEPRGDAELGTRVKALLEQQKIDVQVAARDRRLDHGVWVPLLLMFPDASVPLVQVSATWDAPQRYFEVGRALRPLAAEGVLIFGTGGAVHNLRELAWEGGEDPPDWSRAFDDWVRDRLEAGDWDALRDYRRRAPSAERAHPTEDHFLPLFFAGGAGTDGCGATTLHRSFSHGSLSMAAYGFG